MSSQVAEQEASGKPSINTMTKQEHIHPTTGATPPKSQDHKFKSLLLNPVLCITAGRAEFYFVLALGLRSTIEVCVGPDPQRELVSSVYQQVVMSQYIMAIVL